MSNRRTKKRKKDIVQKKIIGIHQQDTVLKEFFRDNERFADIFNAVFFQGEEKIKADDLEEVDTDISHILSFKQLAISIKHTRDIAKKFVNGVLFVILGTEFQSHIDYGMPVRIMGYDYSSYAGKISKLKKFHRKQKTKLNSHEFLSGFQKTDRLPPVVTLVLYTGREPWDGPLSLHEMLIPMPEHIKSLVADYKIHVLQIQNSEQFHFHNHDVNTLFDITRMAFQKQYEQIYEKYQNQPISQEVVTAIGSITNVPQLMELEQEEKGGTVMFNMLEDCIEYGTERGIERGVELGMLNAAKLLVEQGQAITEIATLLQLSPQKIEEHIKQHNSNVSH